MSLYSVEEDGGSLDVEDELHSPTDVSEDSVEVRVTPIAGRGQRASNKRKPNDPRKLNLSPTPKRRRPSSPSSPFRPWSMPTPPQEEPLALVKARDGVPHEIATAVPTVPVILCSPRSTPRTSSNRFTVESIIGSSSAPSPQPGRAAVSVAGVVDKGGGEIRGRTPQQRNYKNMTRERRIEANARERTRVHTISAAFDTLRKAVPAYSHSQKLSKLSVLRIACSYILTLSRVAGMDYSADQSSPPVQRCVDLVTRTIQTEGKLRRKRDD